MIDVRLASIHIIIYSFYIFPFLPTIQVLCIYVFTSLLPLCYETSVFNMMKF